MWYAEEKTDSIIYESYFAGKTNGIMVEVGAADPTYLSMSKAFKEIGWRTICVEPIPKFAKMHRDARNEIYEYALSRVMADNVTFFMQDDTDDPTAGMSYSSLEIRYNGGGNNKVKEIKVNVRTLNWLLESLDIKEIDLLSVDTEGYEIEVMLGFDTNKYKPSIICLECMDNNIKGVDGYMKNIGYKLDKRIAINSIYKRL